MVECLFYIHKVLGSIPSLSIWGWEGIHILNARQLMPVSVSNAEVDDLLVWLISIPSSCVVPLYPGYLWPEISLPLVYSHDRELIYTLYITESMYSLQSIAYSGSWWVCVSVLWLQIELEDFGPFNSLNLSLFVLHAPESKLFRLLSAKVPLFSLEILFHKIVRQGTLCDWHLFKAACKVSHKKV